jgi:hypothetical protein
MFRLYLACKICPKTFWEIFKNGGRWRTILELSHSRLDNEALAERPVLAA